MGSDVSVCALRILSLGLAHPVPTAPWHPGPAACLWALGCHVKAPLSRSTCSHPPPSRTPSSGCTATGSHSSAGSSPASQVSGPGRAGTLEMHSKASYLPGGALGARGLWFVLGTQRGVGHSLTLADLGQVLSVGVLP